MLDEVRLEEGKKEEQFYARSTVMAAGTGRGQEAVQKSTKSKQVQVRGSVSAQMLLRESLQMPNQSQKNVVKALEEAIQGLRVE